MSGRARALDCKQWHPSLTFTLPLSSLCFLSLLLSISPSPVLLPSPSPFPSPRYHAIILEIDFDPVAAAAEGADAEEYSVVEACPSEIKFGRCVWVVDG